MYFDVFKYKFDKKTITMFLLKKISNILHRKSEGDIKSKRFSLFLILQNVFSNIFYLEYTLLQTFTFQR